MISIFELAPTRSKCSHRCVGRMYNCLLRLRTLCCIEFVGRLEDVHAAALTAGDLQLRSLTIEGNTIEPVAQDFLF